MELWEKIVKVTPGRTNDCEELAGALTNLAGLLLETDRASAAVPHYRRAAEIWQELVRISPGLRLSLSLARMRLAIAMKSTEEPEQARAESRQAVEVFAALAKERPADPGILSNLGSAAALLTELEMASGRPGESLAACYRGIAALEQLDKQPGASLKSRPILALLYRHRGMARANLGQRREALAD